MAELWQVSGRSDLSWDEAVRLDLGYVENWAFSLDCVILLRTLPWCAGVPGLVGRPPADRWRITSSDRGADVTTARTPRRTVPPAVDGAFARWLADGAAELLLDLRAEMGFADPDALRQEGDKQSHEYLAGCWRDGVRTTRCCPRRATGTTRPGSPPSGSGSSTRWTAPASSARTAAPTGRCTSRSGRVRRRRRAGWPRPRSRCRPRTGPWAPTSRRRTRRCRRRSPAAEAAVRGQPDPAAGFAGAASPTSSARNSCRWARPAPRSPR